MFEELPKRDVKLDLGLLFSRPKYNGSTKKTAKRQARIDPQFT